MDTIIGFLNTIFWGYVLIYGLLAVGLYFTVRLGFPQIVHFSEMFRVLSRGGSKDAAGISPFQALMVSLASRVGTGNLAGVAVALYLGGPGVTFWMWIVAFVGMATAYAESALAQLYKIRNEDGQYRGGPAFYIARGLNAPGRPRSSRPASSSPSVWCSTPFRQTRSPMRSRAPSACPNSQSAWPLPSSPAW
ncbi:Na+/alanine symporter [Sinorhizobium meliloti]